MTQQQFSLESDIGCILKGKHVAAKQKSENLDLASTAAVSTQRYSPVFCLFICLFSSAEGWVTFIYR